MPNRGSGTYSTFAGGKAIGGIGIVRMIVPLFSSHPLCSAGTKTRRCGFTALGLSISKNLVERLGRAIGCDSVEGQGLTFWFVVRVWTGTGQ